MGPIRQSRHVELRIHAPDNRCLDDVFPILINSLQYFRGLGFNLSLDGQIQVYSDLLGLEV